MTGRSQNKFVFRFVLAGTNDNDRNGFELDMPGGATRHLIWVSADAHHTQGAGAFWWESKARLSLFYNGHPVFEELFHRGNDATNSNGIGGFQDANVFINGFASGGGPEDWPPVSIPPWSGAVGLLSTVPLVLYPFQYRGRLDRLKMEFPLVSVPGAVDISFCLGVRVTSLLT